MNKKEQQYDNEDCDQSALPRYGLSEEEYASLHYNDLNVWRKYRVKFAWIDNFMLKRDWTTPPTRLSDSAVNILKCILVLEDEGYSINQENICIVFKHLFGETEWPKSRDTFLRYCKTLQKLGLLKMTKGKKFNAWQYKVLIGSST